MSYLLSWLHVPVRVITRLLGPVQILLSVFHSVQCSTYQCTEPNYRIALWCPLPGLNSVMLGPSPSVLGAVSSCSRTAPLEECAFMWIKNAILLWIEGAEITLRDRGLHAFRDWSRHVVTTKHTARIHCGSFSFLKPVSYADARVPKGPRCMNEARACSMMYMSLRTHMAVDNKSNCLNW